MKTLLRIGTRSSAIGLYQAELVKAKIQQDFPLMRIEILKIKTAGHMIRRWSADLFSGKAVFTQELEAALTAGEIDLAVHRAKDLSLGLPEDLEIGAVLHREDVRDCFLGIHGKKVEELQPGARIGASSLRRKTQLVKMRPDLEIEELHGNVDSRIRKIKNHEWDGFVLAYVEIERLGLNPYVTEIFSEKIFYPSPGQGAIAVESRIRDPETEEVLKALNDPVSNSRILCERAFLARLEGGFQFPCGIWTEQKDGRIHAGGGLFDLSGARWVEDLAEGPLEKCSEVGMMLGDKLLERGGREIIEDLKRHYSPGATPGGR